MSWLRRIFGGSGDGDRRAHGDGPVHGQADVPLEHAKARLLALLGERGARSAVIVYDGGHDEGFMTSFEYSGAPLGAAPADWAGSLSDPQAVDIDEAIAAEGGADDALFEAAEAVMCDKWGSFAGEFEVEGRLVVDVGAGTIARIDAVKLDEGDEPEREVEVL